MLPALEVAFLKKSMLRVLCSGRFFDEIPGGMQTHAVNLMRSLAGEVEFTHAVTSRDSKGGRFTFPPGITVSRAPSWNVDGSLAVSPQLVREYRSLHYSRPFDLIHLHFPDPMAHLASMALPAKIPRIVTWHADITRHKLLLPFYRPWLAKSLDSAAAIVVPTPAHVASSKILNSPKYRAKTQVIPFGFDLGAFAAPHPAVEGLKRKYPGQILFALGRHVAYKGFDVLIRALQELPPSVRLILGGEGPLTPDLRGLAAVLGLESRVHFPGFVPEAELPSFYQACDVFCLPSVTPAEAFGIVQVEAMAAGKPVVCSRLGNGVDYVNQHEVTGLTVPPNDPAALAQAIHRLLADPALREKYGRQARVRALREFALEGMRGKTFALYRKFAPASTKR